MTGIYENDIGQIDWDDIFDRQLAPKLASLENARVEAIGIRRSRRLASAALILGLFAVSYYGIQYYDWPINIIVVAAFFVLVGAFIWTEQPTEAFKSNVQGQVMRVVCQALGGANYNQDGGNFDLASFDRLKLLNSYNRTELQHNIEGRYRDCDFSMAYAELRQESGRHSSTAFSGVLLEISMPRPTQGKILIFRDWGSVLNRLSGWFAVGKRVVVPDDEFEKKYEVFAEVESEALNYVTPAFVKNFLALRAVAGSDDIVAGFDGSRFLLAVNGVSEYLAGVSASKPISELRSDVGRAAKEVTLIHRIIDQLHEGN